MGTWDFKVLTNDHALDMMFGLEDIRDIEGMEGLKAHIKKVFHDPESNIDELLLSAEIVDIALNGIDESILGSLYDYEAFFGEVEKSSIGDLRDEAIRTIERIEDIERENNIWVPRMVASRRQLLKKIESRLKTNASDKTGV